MRSLLLGWSWLVVAAATAPACSRAAASTPADGGKRGTGFAVVELFTSEGCSSCPPADDLVRDLAAEASRTGQSLYPLAFHVDYWDDLGWSDPYGSARATSRQHAYSRALGQRGVYTPEMVVNGRDAFVGSDRPRAHRSIESALRNGGGPSIQLQAKVIDDLVSVDFTLSIVPARGTVLQLALVQIEALTRVEAGENAGRTLRHANVVRRFQSVALDGARSGHATLAPLPRAVGAAVIAFLQDPDDIEVRAAARADL